MQVFDSLQSFDRFIYTAGNKDKVMAIVQFLPMALAGPAAKLGCPKMGEALANLSKMADTTRAVGRLTLLAGCLSTGTLKSKANAHPWLIAQHIFQILFGIFENTAVYANHGVLPKSLNRLGGCAVTCWFYVLLTDIVVASYALFSSDRPMTEENKKGLRVRLTKDWLYIIFALSCMPAGGPKLMRTPGGPLEALDLILRYFAPPQIQMDNTVRGLLGLGASICEFYFADEVPAPEQN